MLSNELVKSFIKHPDKWIQRFAVEYFKDSFSKDNELINLVLDSCELYPNEVDNRLILSDAKQFVQTKESLIRIFEL
jgi:hypothetical protein